MGIKSIEQSSLCYTVGHIYVIYMFYVSCVKEGNGNPLWCSSLENPVKRGAQWVAVHKVAQNQTRQKCLSSSSSSMQHVCSVVSYSLQSQIPVQGIFQARMLELLFPSLGDLPNPVFEPMSPALAAGFFTTVPPEKPYDLYSSVHMAIST